MAHILTLRFKSVLRKLELTTRRRPLNKNKNFFFSILTCLFAGLLLLVLSSSSAYAVRVSLKRVVFDGSKRSEILTLINNTAKPQTYRLGWRKYRMDEGKSIRPVREGEDASDVLWADSMVRFAPRRVTVAPGASQQIRLLLRRPADIQEAEYRGHLWIVSEAKPEAFGAEQTTRQAVRLSVQPSISLPVFVRHGNLDVKAEISDTKLTRTTEGLNVKFSLNRIGNRSIYGDFDFVCTDGGNNLVMQQIRGIAVYREIKSRQLDFNLRGKAAGTANSCNTVKIVYRADPNDPDFNGDLLAEATASVN